jgi:hypothetical protein
VAGSAAGHGEICDSVHSENALQVRPSYIKRDLINPSGPKTFSAFDFACVGYRSTKIAVAIKVVFDKTTILESALYKPCIRERRSPEGAIVKLTL